MGPRDASPQTVSTLLHSRGVSPSRAAGTPGERVTELHRCTIQGDNGRFCDADSVPFAPYPICAKHLVRLYQFARDWIAPTREPAAPPPPAQGTIYYLLVGELVKIGFTINLRQRLSSYPPDAVLLVTEQGNPADERARHKQFAQALQHGNEWFRPTPEVLEHIKRLQATTE